MDNSVTDQSLIVTTILRIIKAVASAISQGPVSATLSFILVLATGIFFFIIRGKVVNFFKDLAAKATKDAENKAKEGAAGRVSDNEKELDEIMSKMRELQQTEKKSMLDSLSITELRMYSTDAYGQEVIDNLAGKAKSDIEFRYLIYILYGLD